MLLVGGGMMFGLGVAQVADGMINGNAILTLAGGIASIGGGFIALAKDD